MHQRGSLGVKEAARMAQKPIKVRTQLHTRRRFGERLSPSGQQMKIFEERALTAESHGQTFDDDYQIPEDDTLSSNQQQTLNIQATQICEIENPMNV